MSRLTRRQFLYGSAAALGSLSTAPVPAVGGSRQAEDSLPRPEKSGIEHVVVVMMENRSFDHLLGWLPRRRRPAGRPRLHGRQGTALRDLSAGARLPGVRPSRSRSFLRRAAGSSTTAASATAGCAPAPTTSTRSATTPRPTCRSSARPRPDWTVCNRYFAPIMAPTYPNRIYQHAAVTDRLDDSLSLSTLPTIWDRLADAGLVGRYYFSDVPFLALWGHEVRLDLAALRPVPRRTAPPGPSPRSPSSTRRSPARTPAPPPTTIRTATSAPARPCSTRPTAR